MAVKKGNMFDIAAQEEAKRREEAAVAPIEKRGKADRAPYNKDHQIIFGADEALFQFVSFMRFKNKGVTNTDLVTKALLEYYGADLRMFCAIKPEYSSLLEGVCDA